MNRNTCMNEIDVGQKENERSNQLEEGVLVII
jgi:hypothetical protein